MNFRWHQRDEKAGTLLEDSTLLETSSPATRSPRWPSERSVTSDCRSFASSTSASYVNLGFSSCGEWVCCSVESVTCNCSLLPGRLLKDSFTIFLQIRSYLMVWQRTDAVPLLSLCHLSSHSSGYASCCCVITYDKAIERAEARYRRDTHEV